MFRRFQTKLILLFVALFAVVQLASLVVVQNATKQNIFAQSRDELIKANDIFKDQLQDISNRLIEGTSLLAQDFGFRRALATEDLPTILSALDNLGARIGADRVLVVDLDNKVTADNADNFLLNQPFPFPDLLDTAIETEWSRSIVYFEQAIYLIAAVPVRAPLPIATIVIAEHVNSDMAADLQGQATLPIQVSFVYEDGETLRATASTHSSSNRQGLGSMFGPEGIGASTEPQTLPLDGVDFVTLVDQLETEAGSPNVFAILQYSLDEALEPYQSLFLVLIGLAVLALLLTFIFSVVIARGVARPLTVLDDAARRIEAGDYSEKVQVNQADEIGRLSGTFNDMMDGISEREEKIAYQSLHDTLTGLPNRRQFENRLREVLDLHANDKGYEFSVLLIAIERFSEINNTLGHDNGDLLIKQIGSRLQNDVKQSDLLARLASDEFVILMPKLNSEACESIGQRILDSFEHPFGTEGVNIDVSARIGIAAYPEHGNDPKSLLQRADIAVYEAAANKQHVAVYDAEQDPHKPERLSMMGELRKGLEQGEFEFYYQPKVDIKTGKITAVEALIRWIHPEHGFMPPDDFIPLAEQTGHVQKLTEWALREGFGQCRQWLDAGDRIRMGINLSARDLTNRSLPVMVHDLLTEFDLPPELIILEITESAVMEDPQRALSVLNSLKNMGVSLAIDDYGIGYSSLSYLKKLPVSEIKVDKSFVMDLATNAEDEILVRSTVDLGHNLGLKVTAEGVEDIESLDKLSSYGCETAQGYHISKPLPVAAFEEFMATSPYSSRSNTVQDTAQTG